MVAVHRYDQPDDHFACRLLRKQCKAQVPSGGRRGSVRRCHTRSILHPFCTRHARTLLGLRVGHSPIHGCGLFATRTFERGDVLVPYTGVRHASADEYGRDQRHGARLHRRGPSSPYVYPTHPGYVDAACKRGLASYANQPRRGRSETGFARRVNARVVTLSVGPHDEKYFLATDAEGYCAVSPDPVRTGMPSKFTAAGWVRVPAVLLDRLKRGKRRPWLVATRRIHPDQEILLDYMDQHDMLDIAHRTTPRPC